MIGAAGHRRHSGRVHALAGALAIGTLTALVGLGAPQAQADTAPVTGTPATVSADALPTWQINGVVWDTVTVGNIVYATGNFSRARPPGTKLGDPSQVTRRNLLAFDIRTGVVTSFNHSLNAQGRRIVASPDGRTLYVGGDFTTVDGKAHLRIAAFDLTTGALKSGFKPLVNGPVRAIAANSGNVVYIGGTFTKVAKASRQRLAAVRATSGTPFTWAPRADRVVRALIIAPGNRVIVGGAFGKLNGQTKVGIGALHATTGKQVTWTSRPIPSFVSYKRYSMVTDLVLSGDTIFGTADGESYHYFDGRFAAKASNGNLIWLDNCYGATYSGFVRGQVFYSVGHPHDCSSVKAFPETDPKRYRRTLAETTYATGRDSSPKGRGSHYSKQPVPSLLHWYPTLTAGTFTGQSQAAWAITGNADYVALAGEFLTVNGIAQQGLTRFGSKAVAPNRTGPYNSYRIVPTLSSPRRGVVHVAYKRTWDQDNAHLTYRIYRDGTLVHTAQARSEFWSLTGLSFDDTGLAAGSRHTYRISVTDPFGNSRTGATSAEVTVAG